MSELANRPAPSLKGRAHAVLFLLAVPLACWLAACGSTTPEAAADGAEDGGGATGDVDGGGQATADNGGSLGSTSDNTTGETCGNGLDDNGDGEVDEGCSCTLGAEQKCFAGPPAIAGVGACVFGKQKCVAGSSELALTKWGACVGSGNADGGACAKPVPVAPCTGTGRIFATLGDNCIDDNGSNGVGDQLEVYCVKDVARFCLSHEACPWREGKPTVSDDVTCSRAGIPKGSKSFAKAREKCGVWKAHELYCCSPEGKISFSGC